MNVASMVYESQAGKAILWTEIRHDAFSNLGYPLHSTISGYLPSNCKGKIERGKKKINLLDILNIYTESPSKGFSMAMLLHYWNMFPSFLGEFIPSLPHAPPSPPPKVLGDFITSDLPAVQKSHADQMNCLAFPWTPVLLMRQICPKE